MKRIRPICLICLLLLIMITTAFSSTFDLTFRSAIDTKDEAQSVFVQGDYAYVADSWKGLQVIDISDPSFPSIIGSLETIGAAGHISVVGSYAYISCAYSGLVIIDVSIPSTPQYIGKYETDSPGGSFIEGNYAFLAAGDVGLLIIDISDPYFPSLEGSYDTPGNAYDVYVKDNYAYVADGGQYEDGGLQIIDISNLSSPTFKGSANTVGWENSVVVQGSYAYVSTGGYGGSEMMGLRIINISNPSSPKVISSYITDRFASDVFVLDNYAYIADWEGGLVVIDVLNPFNPKYGDSYTAFGIGVFATADNVFLTSINPSKLTIFEYSSAGLAPTPDIEANGSDGPITIARSDILAITMQLDSGTLTGDEADWWLVALTPFGWYHYDKTLGWIPGREVTIQINLRNFPSREVLNMSGLPAGIYTFYFGVDLNKNGRINVNQAYYDSVKITIIP